MAWIEPRRRTQGAQSPRVRGSRAEPAWGRSLTPPAADSQPGLNPPTVVAQDAGCRLQDTDWPVHRWELPSRKLWEGRGPLPTPRSTGCFPSWQAEEAAEQKSYQGICCLVTLPLDCLFWLHPSKPKGTKLSNLTKTQHHFKEYNEA